MALSVRDEKGRRVIYVRDGKLAIARFPDMTDEMKEYLLDSYGDLTDGDVERLRLFLNYESEEEEFCV